METPNLETGLKEIIRTEMIGLRGITKRMKDHLKRTEEIKIKERTGEVIEGQTKMMAIMTEGRTKTEILKKENPQENSKNQEEKERPLLRSMKSTREQRDLGLLLR